MASYTPRLTVAGADALTLSQLTSASPTMDLTMLLQLQALYQQMAVMEALMAMQTGGLYPGTMQAQGLGALGTAAYRSGLGNGGPRRGPIRPGSISRASRPIPRIVPANRGSQPRLPPPPPRHH
jgi:hypothetical protein